MNFKELRANNTVHILDKSNGAKYIQGRVVSVGQPRFDMQQPTQAGAMPNFNMPSMIVDVTIEADGKTETYKFAENTSVAGVGSMLFSTDKEGVIRELDATISHCEQYFADEEKMRNTLEQSKALKSELDSSYKERQETENRFLKLEKVQEEQGAKLDTIIEMLQNKQ